MLPLVFDPSVCRKMLRSALTPIFSAFPTKTLPARTSSSAAETKPPQGVRRNAPPNYLGLLHLPPTSAYVHLPFCRRRCHYCDFPIVALGSSSSSEDPRIANYVDLICREIAATAGLSPNARHPPLETVFFGGGTPSLVPPRLVRSVLDALAMRFGVGPDVEVSMEMDPGTFGERELKEVVGAGVNRVSLGVQAFQEEMLRSCGRAHGLKEVDEAIEVIVGSCNVENWSIDLIASLPRQTPEMWEESLRRAIDARPAHVSVYDLQVEQGTKFATMYRPGEHPLPSEKQSAEFYRMASKALSDAGFNHYEISSYCKTGYECKHNSTYWDNKPFYGFGLGATSFLNGLRFPRPKKLKDYEGYVQSLESRTVTCFGEKNGDLNAGDVAMDVVMLALRTAKGLDLKSFGEAFGSSSVMSLLDVYKPYVETGHVLWLDEQGRNVTVGDAVSSIRLSDPEGFLLSNELISLAFCALG